MDSKNVKNLKLERYFEGMNSTEKSLLSNIPLMKYRNYCFEKYINVDESNLSNQETNDFFGCYENLQNLHVEWNKLGSK